MHSTQFSISPRVLAFGLTSILFASLLRTSSRAEVSLPACFSDHAVLQREAPIPVWGWASPGEKVSVALGQKDPLTVTTEPDGTWRVALPKEAAGGPFTLTVTGKNTLTIKDILIGEVWLCSGQSNMEWIVNNSLNPEQERAAATDGSIRQLLIPKRPLSQPDTHVTASWVPASPETVGNFTACGYFMARKLREELGVPIGLIHSSWGGTRIEPWTTPAGFRSVDTLKEISTMLAEFDPASPTYQDRNRAHLAAVEAWAAAAKVALDAKKALLPFPILPGDSTPLAERENPQQQPTTLYNGMIHPVVGYGMRGAIWYQGESNHNEGMLYTDKMKALIQGWRDIWGIGDFPFNFVQIAPFQYGQEDPGILPRFWVAQQAALAIPNTGMVVTTDISNLQDIHPRNKQDVGLRLALLALRNTYEKSDVVAEGPTYRSSKAEGSTMQVHFDHAKGLKTRDGKSPDWFELLDGSGESDWQPAEAKIEGDTIVLSSVNVKTPVGVRFAWSKVAEPNLVNEAGLPAPAFSAGGISYTDSLPKLSQAKDYTLIYDLDLARLSHTPDYAIDNHAKSGDFDRVAYLLELQKEGRPVRYVWAEMDAFTQDAAKLGIPVPKSGAQFQKAVKNLTVASNEKGIATGEIGDGLIEFWPNNYGPANTANILGASNEAYDFGDQFSEPPLPGYGSMQVHNPGAKQTLFAVNNFAGGAGADLGIGNSEGKNPDWTFSGNAGTYVTKRLRVFVRKK